MTFVVLDDITSGMKKPCVMDVKIGLQTWEPGCSEKKKKDENVIKLRKFYVIFDDSYSNYSYLKSRNIIVYKNN